MLNSFHRYRVFVASVLAVVLVAAACSSDDDVATTNDASTSSGRIMISGSSTVEPISAAVAKLFNAENPDVVIEVSGPGTGDGFARFCAGETDISDASRPISSSEAQECGSVGVELIELLVGVDGLTVVTDHQNDVECLTIAQLYALMGPDSTGFDNWADANALLDDRFHGEAPLPDKRLTVFAPGEESGTYDFFVETIVQPVVEARVEAGELTEDEAGTLIALREDYDPQANDNVIKQGIANTPDSLGFFGAAFVDESVKALAVDGGDGCTAPSPENIGDASYPISRPLFIYVNAKRLAANAALRDFVDLYLSPEGLAQVTEVGYVRNPAEAEAAEAARVENGTTGPRA